MRRSYWEWPNLVEVGTRLIGLESRPGDRASILRQFGQWGQKLDLPVYFWNSGYNSLQHLTENGLTKSQQLPELARGTTVTSGLKSRECERPLVEILEREEPGIYLLEGLLQAISPPRRHELKNLFDVLSRLGKSGEKIVLTLWEEDYIELPKDIQPLIPVLRVPLPTAAEVQQQIEAWCSSASEAGKLDCYFSQDAKAALVRACRGLTSGEIEIVLDRALAWTKSLSQVTTAVLQHKIGKLRGQGLEHIGNPDVEVAGGLDLLDGELQKICSLLDPKAREFNLEFPKGILLWGPPGTGKSLSAKLAAQKMGIPLLAADWGAILGADDPDRNLRNLLELCESMSPTILWFDDFDKGFAGWDSNRDGGVSRRLSGKLLTWMQERTAPVFLLATVNRLHFLPPELIRRFEERIWFVDLPHKGARYQIFQIHLSKYFPSQFSKGEDPWSEEDWRILLREYNLTTPAEIGNAVRQVAERIFHHHKLKGEEPEELRCTPEDLLYQRSLFVPAMIRDEEAIWAIRNRASFARPATGPDRSRFADPPAELFEASRTSS